MAFLPACALRRWAGGRPRCAARGASVAAEAARRSSVAERLAASAASGAGRLTEKTELERYGADNATQRHLPKRAFGRSHLIRSARLGREGSEKISDLYEFRRKLGAGGFGVVHEAQDKRTGELVAIKTIPKENQLDFELEVEFLKVADHPNVVRHYETFEDEGNAHLVMELCTGGALVDCIADAHRDRGLGFSEVDLAKITAQMLRSVAFCHAHCIVHRDLKPQNFLFGCGARRPGSLIPISCSSEQEAPLKLVDFGISGVVRGDRPQKRLLTRRAGTEGYMAPEVCKGRAHGPPVDLFSVGAVMHTVISGEVPAWQPNFGAYRFPGQLRWKQLSGDGQALLRRLLDEDPAKRPSVIEAVQDRWFEAMGVVVPAGGPALFRQCLESLQGFSRRSMLQRAVMFSVVALAPLHSDSMERLRTAFLAINTGASGQITGDEFSAFVESVRSTSGSLGEADAQELFEAADGGQDGEIAYSEWLAAAAPQEWYADANNPQRAFFALDQARHGYITAEDLCEVLPTEFSVEELHQEVQTRFPAGSGQMSLTDFCSLAQNTLEGS